MRHLKDFILDSLSNTNLFEQAMNRKDIINKIIYHSGQIIENWALIVYCNFYDENNLNINHWKQELSTQCDQIFYTEIKGSSREKAISYAILDKMELNNSDIIYKIISKKFKKENFNNIDRIHNVAKYVSENINELINALNNDPDAWIENL